MEPDRPAPRDACSEEDARAGLLARLGVTFQDPALLSQALEHPSYTSEREADPLTSNERLEFLGDAVIELAVSDYLYREMPACSEGELTVLRSFVVRGSSLAEAAARLGLDDALRLGRGAQLAGRARSSLLACGLEAVIGALFLDQGWAVARDCVLRILEPNIRDAAAQRQRNYKGELQELTQERNGVGPTYRLLAVSGPPHQREFLVEVWLGGRPLGQGRAGSKKEAEQRAAAAALAELAGSASTTSME